MRNIVFIIVTLLALVAIIFLVCLVGDIILTYKTHREMTKAFKKLVFDDIDSLQQELETYQQMLQVAKEFSDPADDHSTENQPGTKIKATDKPSSRVSGR